MREICSGCGWRSAAGSARRDLRRGGVRGRRGRGMGCRVAAVSGRPSPGDVRAMLEAGLAPELVRGPEQLVDDRVAEALAEHTATANNGRRWLTLAEAGERLGCSADAVRMRVKRGRLVAERQGARLYVSVASVDARVTGVG